MPNLAPDDDEAPSAPSREAANDFVPPPTSVTPSQIGDRTSCVVSSRPIRPSRLLLLTSHGVTTSALYVLTCRLCCCTAAAERSRRNGSNIFCRMTGKKEQETVILQLRSGVSKKRNWKTRILPSYLDVKMWLRGWNLTFNKAYLMGELSLGKVELRV